MDSTTQLDARRTGALGGSRLVRLFDSFFVLRPTLIFPLLTTVLAGHRLAGGEAASLDWEHWLSLGVALTSLFGLVYLINQLRDAHGDRINGKLFLVSEGVLNHRHLRLEAFFLAAVSVTFLLASGMAQLLLWVALMFLVAGLLYNFTPLALQQRPWGGVIAGFWGGWLLLRSGAVVVGGGTTLWGELPYMAAFASGCLLTTLLDVEGDRRTGKRTWAVVYGERSAMLTALTGVLAAVLTAAVQVDWVILVPAAATTPLLFIAWRRGSVALAVTTNKLAILLLSVAVGLHYPAFLAVMGLYFVFARWYYRRRMGLTYPTLKGA